MQQHTPAVHSAIDPDTATEALPAFGASLPTRREATQHSWRMLFILSILMAFGSISTDVYLPAMPAMSLSLAASQSMMEWTVSAYLIGFSLGQLFWGPIGDRYGRRRPVAVGLVLFMIGSVGCGFADSAHAMIIWRIVQATGACAGVVLGRAMVSDLYEGERAAQMLSTLITVMGIVPLIGPMLGGQILVLSGWRTIFAVLVGIGLITLIALAILPETLAPEHRNREPIGAALLRYGTLLRHRRLLAYSGAGAFFYSGMFAYIAGTPFAYITYHHLDPRYYGVLFAIGIVGIMLASMVNSKIVTRIGSTRLLRYGTMGAAFSGILLAIIAHTDVGGLTGLVTILFIYISMTGLIVANSIAGAMTIFPERTGSVSALVGAMQYGSGMVGSALVGAFADGTPWPMGAVIALMGIGSFACAITLKEHP